MATINLTVKLNQTGAISHRIRYARIDNVVTPVWTTVSPDVVNSPNLTEPIAENIPNGQYRIGYKAIYSDLRTCEEQFTETAPCPGLISINAYLDGTNIVVQYLAPSEAAKVRITVSYPNGGSTVNSYVNNGNDIPIVLPDGVYGDFYVSGQAVCDEDTAFFSPPSSQVVVNRPQNTVTISNQSSDLTITDVSGISGFDLGGLFIAPTGIANGSHNAFSAAISLTVTTGTTFSGSATLTLNGTLIQCVNIVSGTINFNLASFAETDLITVQLNVAAC
jgi:hypothetical protein